MWSIENAEDTDVARGVIVWPSRCSANSMKYPLTNGPWIVAQMIRIRKLEREVKDLLAKEAPHAPLSARMAELKSQVTLLDLALG